MAKKARVYVTLKRGVLDPQGSAVNRALHAMGYGEVSDVRLGKFIEVTLDDQENYVNHGRFTTYDERGVVQRTGQYCMGKQQGPWRRYFRAGDGSLFSGELDSEFSGPFVSEANFSAGQLHGTWTITSKTGQKIIEWPFVNGVRHGVCMWWYPNGEKRRQVEYKNGRPIGERLEWDTSGRQATKAVFINGRLLTEKVEWYAPGKKRYEGSYLMAQDLAETTFDWWNGAMSVTPIGKAGEDQKHGRWTSFHPNGQKESEGRFEEGQPDGKFTWWYETGQTRAEGTYKMGQKVGVWTTWYASGQKESRGEYEGGGDVTGKWRLWREDGRLVEIRDFNGKPKATNDTRRDGRVATAKTNLTQGPSLK